MYHHFNFSFGLQNPQGHFKIICRRDVIEGKSNWNVTEVLTSFGWHNLFLKFNKYIWPHKHVRDFSSLGKRLCKWRALNLSFISSTVNFTSNCKDYTVSHIVYNMTFIQKFNISFKCIQRNLISFILKYTNKCFFERLHLQHLFFFLNSYFSLSSIEFYPKEIYLMLDIILLSVL